MSTSFSCLQKMSRRTSFHDSSICDINMGIIYTIFEYGLLHHFKTCGHTGVLTETSVPSIVKRRGIHDD